MLLFALPRRCRLKTFILNIRIDAVGIIPDNEYHCIRWLAGSHRGKQS